MELNRILSRVKKKTVTFTIDNKVNDEFIEIATRLMINKSLLIEEAIKDFVKQYKTTSTQEIL